MVATPVKVLLFLIGGAGAAGATAYVAGVLDPWIYGKDAVAVGIAETAPDEAAPKGERVGSDGTPPADATPPVAEADAPPADAPKEPEIAALTPDEPPAADSTPPAAETEVVDPSIPRFDVVRVEPDGSIVIAGKAPPQSYVEVLTPAEVIATDSATPEGDFAAVPDERLKPGDYEIKLRAIAPGNIVTLSEETALVSIPEEPDGQVLALVEKPGEPSRIITLPAVTAPAEPEVAAAPEAENPADAAAAPEPEKPAEVAAAPEAAEPKPEGEAAVPAETAPAQPGGEQEIAAVDPAPADAGETAPPANAADPATPPADAAGGTTPPAAGEAEIAAVEPKPEEPAKPAAPAVKITVEAVEIDGRKVFVAGASDPGMPVRVYANEMLLGENRSSAEGRYLIEAERDLPVGDYIIRADVLAPDGTVIARAAVPFEREPGEAIAAVAPPAAEPAKEPETAAEPSAPGAEGAKQPEVAAAPEAPGASDSGGAPDAPKEPEVAAAPEPAAPETGAAPEAADAGKQPDVAAAPEPSQPEKQPEVAAAPEPGTPAKEPETAAEPAAPAAPGGQAEAPAPEPVTPEKAPEIAGTPPAEITAPKLEASGSGVIIRRGDTLWRISKRVYGRGVRYSTIYLANQEQIEDPDRIWPGQVFKVPEKTDQGEAADMTQVGEQATSVQ